MVTINWNTSGQFGEHEIWVTVDADSFLGDVNRDNNMAERNIIVGRNFVCSYIIGDANSNHTFNGLDVTYSVSYFKGGPPPPYSCECPPHGIWYVAGDVNASCSFNGLDVTYMVAYFKGGPSPHPCADCPPSGLFAPPAPGEKPTPDLMPKNTPILKAKDVIKSNN
jgi:hypothetical protein